MNAITKMSVHVNTASIPEQISQEPAVTEEKSNRHSKSLKKKKNRWQIDWQIEIANPKNYLCLAQYLQRPCLLS